jgi:hypothetical protein
LKRVTGGSEEEPANNRDARRRDEIKICWRRGHLESADLDVQRCVACIQVGSVDKTFGWGTPKS